MSRKAGPQSPFPGPRPYQAGERERFHGRAGERRDLAALVIANRLTVLYGPTGAGKTSLLAAGLAPELERAGFQVMPIARPGGLLPPGTDPLRVRNVYTTNLLMHWHDGDLEEVVKHTITSFLEAMPDDQPERPLALIIDQTEDLFTTHAAGFEQREAFLRELAECIAPPERGVEERPVRVCLTIRDEALAELERYADLLPDLLRVRFRLDPLRRPAAVEVMTAAGMFSAADADKLAGDLAHRRVRLSGRLATVPSEFVEPLQLQLVCDEKWRRGGRNGPLAKPRDPDEALVRYVDAAVARARSGWGAEAKIRRFLGDRLVTPEGARSPVLRGKRSTGGLSNKLVDRLEQEHLLRAVERLGARWYELAHDRLVEPLRLSNQTWRESQRRRRAARRVALGLLLLTGLGVAGYFLVDWALKTYHGLEGEKSGVEAELAEIDRSRHDLEQALAQAAGAHATERLRAGLRAVDVDLVALADDVQAARGVLAGMSRFSPRGRDGETADLTNFVALGAELPGLGARLDDLTQRHAGLDAELSAAVTAHAIVEADLTQLSKETAARAPELERLRSEIDAVTADHARQRTRLLADLARYDAPSRAGSPDARARDASRQLWRDAFVLLQRGSVDDARGRFERAHLRDSSNAAAWDMLGRIAHADGDLKLAEQSYRKALSHAPDYGPSLGGMASLYYAKEWFLDAERCAREALSAQPDLIPARAVLRAVQQRRHTELESDEEGLSAKNPCGKGPLPANTADEPAAEAPAKPAAPAKPKPAAKRPAAESADAEPTAEPTTREPPPAAEPVADPAD